MGPLSEEGGLGPLVPMSMTLFDGWGPLRSPLSV